MNKVNGYTIPDGFKVVTKDEFFECMSTKDVHPRPEKYHSRWETRACRVVGYTFPGYLCKNETTGKYEGGKSVYALKENNT